MIKRLRQSRVENFRATLAPQSRFLTVLLVMVAVRWLMVALLVLGLPSLEGSVLPWYFLTGGDQHNYFNLAFELAHGQTVNELVSLGSALLMVPFIWLSNASQYRDIVAPLLVINGFVLGGASVALTGLVGKRYTGDDRIGLLSAALWLLLPIFVYVGVSFHQEAALLRGSLLPKIMWLTGVSDGPASFGILLGVAALGRALERESPRAYLVAGLGLGWAVMFRIAVAPVVALILGVLVLARAWRGLLWVCVGGLLGYLPQAAFNTVEYGFPLYSSYLRNVGPGEGTTRSLSQILTQLPYSPASLIDSLAYFATLYIWLMPFVALLLVAGLVVFVRLWRARGWPYGALLVGVPLGHLFASLATFVFPADPVRHSMLAYPYLLVIVTYIALWAWNAILPRPDRAAKTAHSTFSR